MRVTLLHVASCPNLTLARDRVEAAAALAGLHPVIDERLVDDVVTAEDLGFIGSPTILIDGVDPFVNAAATPSLSCRLYPTDVGLQGAPSVESIVEALRR